MDCSKLDSLWWEYPVSTNTLIEKGQEHKLKDSSEFLHKSQN